MTRILVQQKACTALTIVFYRDDKRKAKENDVTRKRIKVRYTFLYNTHSYLKHKKCKIMKMLKTDLEILNFQDWVSSLFDRDKLS